MPDHEQTGPVPEWRRSGLLSSSREIARAGLLLGAIALLAGIFWAASDVLMPYVVGLLFAYILLPPVRWIDRHLPLPAKLEGARRVVSTLLVFAASLLGLLVLMRVLLKPLIEQTSAMLNAFPDYWDTLLAEHGTVRNWYQATAPVELQQWVSAHVAELGQAILAGFAGLFDLLLNLSGSMLSAGTAMIMAPLFVMYFLIDEPKWAKQLRHQIPGAWANDAISMLTMTGSVFGDYVRGVIVIAGVVGVVTGFSYWLIGVNLALPLGVIAFCGEIVPIVGPWLAFCISAPVILATQPHLILPAGFVFLAVQLLDDWFLSPRIEGGVVDFNPAQTLLLVAIGGGIGGAIGMIFAIPAAAIIRQIVLYTDLRLRGVSPEETFAIVSARPGQRGVAVDPVLRSAASGAAKAGASESSE